MTQHLTLRYTNTTKTGYGRLGVKLHQALTQIGVDVQTDFEIPKPSKSVLWVALPYHARRWIKGQHRSVFTMWETDTVPYEFRTILPLLDSVIVPSKFNQEMFLEFNDNVHLANLAIDADWHFRPRLPSSPFFYFLTSGYGHRKGLDLVYEAFKKAFPDAINMDPIPRLMMKCPRVCEYEGDSDVMAITGKLSDEEEVDLYAGAHCYVTASRGEGFGLQPLQAIAQGIPTILTNAHGHAEFAHLASHALDCHKVPADYIFTGHAEGQKWWEPNFDELVDSMKDVYERGLDQKRRLASASTAAHSVYQWRYTANETLDGLSSTDILPPAFSDNITWEELQEYRYPVVLRYKYSVDVAGEFYSFTPGKKYFVSQSMKRVLFEADVLDPNHIDEDALTPAQVEKMPEYIERHQYCKTCRQRFGSGERLSDTV